MSDLKHDLKQQVRCILDEMLTEAQLRQIEGPVVVRNPSREELRQGKGIVTRMASKSELSELFRGLKGADGKDGAPGAPGVSGPKGDSGKDAVIRIEELKDGGIRVIDANSEKIVADLLIARGKDSIVPGPKGPKGDPGKDSIVPGPKGDLGDKGPQGPKGERGETGPRGETGATGASGERGAQGKAGATGAAGRDGLSESDIRGIVEQAMVSVLQTAEFKDEAAKKVFAAVSCLNKIDQETPPQVKPLVLKITNQVRAILQESN